MEKYNTNSTCIHFVTMVNLFSVRPNAYFDEASAEVNAALTMTMQSTSHQQRK